jgi:hypothetical protein
MPLPRIEVEIHYDIDWSALVEPTEQLEILLPLNREYVSDLAAEATWELAAECLRFECEAVAEIAQEATDQDSFDEAAFEDDAFVTLFGLELGVEAACVALSAAGCMTASSCRGHSSGWSRFPVIVFVADRRRAALVEAVAREVGCGLQSDLSERTLELWAPSITEIQRLASRVIARRAEFDGLPLPASVRHLRDAAAADARDDLDW